MKKFILISALGLSIMTLQSFKPIKNENKAKIEKDDCQYGQCAAIKADGYQCKNCAQKNSYYCWSHR